MISEHAETIQDGTERSVQSYKGILILLRRAACLKTL